MKSAPASPYTSRERQTLETRVGGQALRSYADFGACLSQPKTAGIVTRWFLKLGRVTYYTLPHDLIDLEGI